MTSTKTTNGETIKINPFESYFVPADGENKHFHKTAHIKSVESQGNHMYNQGSSIQSNYDPSMMSD